MEPGFFAYQLINADFNSQSGNGTNNHNGDPILAFGGKAYAFGNPSGKQLYLFNLTPDAFQVSQGGAIGPFASAGSSPNVDLTKPPPSVSHLEMLTNDAANPAKSGSGTVWLQTSLYINTTPANPVANTSFDQQSFVNVALGDTNSAGGLVGARRGGANVDVSYQNNCSGTCNSSTPTREALAFTGDIATLAGPDGSTFLGTANPNIVIGIDSTGTHNIGRDMPLFNPQTADQTSGATYHVGIGALAPTTGVQTGGTVNGYAAGIFVMQAAGGLGDNEIPVGALMSGKPEDVAITFNAQQNTLAATFTLAGDKTAFRNNGTGGGGGVTIGFGGQGRSAFIDNQHYAAIETLTPGVTTVTDHNAAVTPNSATAYLVSGDQINVTTFFPATFVAPPGANGNSPAFCTNCDFLKWGAWGARLNFTDQSQQSVSLDGHLGWYVAGNLTTPTELDALASPTTKMTATYTGAALGDVAKLSGNQWQTYTAAGDLIVNWNFGDRNGNLNINNFDGHSFGTTDHGLTQPSLDINQFSGQLSGSGLTGSATGSFANNVVQHTPVVAGGVLGNWNVGNDVYKATGIFAGSGTPH